MLNLPYLPSLPQNGLRRLHHLDMSWLRDVSLEESANLPSPEVLAAEIVEDLRSALVQFEAIEDELEDEE